MESSPHTSSAFDQDLHEMSEKVRSLANLVERQLRAVTQSLSTLEDKGLDKLIRRDKKVDKLESEIIEQGVQVIALRAPLAEDLRRVLVIQKIATILERMGDYARNTANRTKVILAEGPEAVPVTNLQQMAELTCEMLVDVMAAFDNVDAEMAIKVRNGDVKVDKLHTKLHRDVVKSAQNNPDQIVANVHLLFIAKNFERIGDYATGIAEQVYFLANGTFVDEFRPKADKTSWNA